MPKKGSTPLKAKPILKKNDKGEIINWSRLNEDGKTMKTLVDTGVIKQKDTPRQVMEKFPQFKKYQYSTLNYGLTSARTSFNKEVESRGLSVEGK